MFGADAPFGLLWLVTMAANITFFLSYHILVAANFSHFFPLIICLSGQNLYGADEPAGLPLQLHEEAALHRAGEDAGGRHRHHHEVHPLRIVESHG